MKRAGVGVAVGRYDEARAIYLSGPFASGGRATDERRTVHLGIDLFVEPGTTVRAPLPGVVHVLANNTRRRTTGRSSSCGTRRATARPSTRSTAT